LSIHSSTLGIRDILTGRLRQKGCGLEACQPIAARRRLEMDQKYARQSICQRQCDRGRPRYGVDEITSATEGFQKRNTAGAWLFSCLGCCIRPWSGAGPAWEDWKWKLERVRDHHFCELLLTNPAYVTYATTAVEEVVVVVVRCLARLCRWRPMRAFKPMQLQLGVFYFKEICSAVCCIMPVDKAALTGAGKLQAGRARRIL
jgi:hypothetical protein